MKRVYILIFLAGIVAGCSSLKTRPLTHYSTQITFYHHSAEYYTGGQILKCKLSDTAVLDGYTCVSWIYFFPNGQIRRLKTASEIPLPNCTIPENSTVFFNELDPGKIKYVWLSEDVTISGINCKGGGKISTQFFVNDSLESCFLTGDQKIQGFSCKSSLLHPVYFYMDGRIKMFTLSTDSKFGNTLYKKDETIMIGEDGRVSRYVL